MSHSLLLRFQQEYSDGLNSESVILLTKNGHVAHNGTKMCMCGSRGSLKNWVSLYSFTIPILPPSHPQSHPMPTLKLTESTHTSIINNINSKIPVLWIYNTQVTNIWQCCCVYLISGKAITARKEKSTWKLAFKNNEHEIKS